MYKAQLINVFTALFSLKPFLEAVALDTWVYIPVHSSPMLKFDCPICMMLAHPSSCYLEPTLLSIHNMQYTISNIRHLLSPIHYDSTGLADPITAWWIAFLQLGWSHGTYGTADLASPMIA
jgi:hypothetical protein